MINRYDNLLSHGNIEAHNVSSKEHETGIFPTCVVLSEPPNLYNRRWAKTFGPNQVDKVYLCFAAGAPTSE